MLHIKIKRSRNFNPGCSLTIHELRCDWSNLSAKISSPARKGTGQRGSLHLDPLLPWGKRGCYLCDWPCCVFSSKLIFFVFLCFFCTLLNKAVFFFLWLSLVPLSYILVELIFYFGTAKIPDHILEKWVDNTFSVTSTTRCSGFGGRTHLQTQHSHCFEAIKYEQDVIDSFQTSIITVQAYLIFVTGTTGGACVKKFLSVVNFSRLSEKNAYIWLFQRHF